MPLSLYKKPITRIHKMIGVAAGKGGVGKSFVAASLARILKNRGYKVGLLDADLYGPSIKKIIPEETPPRKEDNKWIPARGEGIKLLSMAHFRNGNEGIVIRAPIASGLIDQFIGGTEWGELDFLIIDFPPGTGDIALTITQRAPLDGVILVTTPQEMSLIDVRRAAKMLEETGVPLLGIVENMSFFAPSTNHEPVYPFGKGGGSHLSQELKVPLLAEIPLEPEAGRLCDLGFSFFATLTPLKAIFDQIADQVTCFVSQKRIRSMNPIDLSHFDIEWSDGLKQRFNLYTLQKLCPCAACQGKGASQDSVEARGVSEVGRYAIKIDFMSGCTHGIYPLDYLRKIGTATAC